MTAQPTDEWNTIESPTDARLTAVTETVTGPWAVGPDGVVIGREGGEVSVAIPDGPAASANTLLDVAVTAAAERLWFAGSSGALGAYDVTTRRKYDYTAPDEKTSTWEAVAVAGGPGDERLLLANGSGEVQPATVDARGCPRFGPVAKPGSGSSITALDFGGDHAYAVDTSGGVYARPVDGDAWVEPADDRLRADGAGTAEGVDPREHDDRPPDRARNGSADRDGNGGSTDRADDEEQDADDDGDPDEEQPDEDEQSPTGGSDGWRRIGIENAQVDFRDVAADGDRLFVAADDGLIYRYDRACRNWTPVSVAEENLHGIDVVGDTVVVAGEEGTVATRTAECGWHRIDAPVDVTLTGVALGTSLYVVGAEGTVVERGVDG